MAKARVLFTSLDADGIKGAIVSEGKIIHIETQLTSEELKDVQRFTEKVGKRVIAEISDAQVDRLES